MVTRSNLWLVLAISLCGTLPAQTYKTEPLIEEIKTLRTIVDDDFKQLPVIDLQGSRHLTISFDYLADEQPWLSYRIVHCDARWQPDDLSELDYVDAVMPVRLDTPEPSFNTITTNYYHYEIGLPNENIRLLVSGNYAVIFTDDDEPDTPVAMATFSVNEQMAFVKGEVTGNTDIDFCQRHQQLNLEVQWSEQQLPYLNAAEELTLVVRQNRRNDMRREVRQPMRIQNGKAFYEHNRDLIFEGGNPWRQFENIDERYPGVNVDHQRFTNMGYDVWLLTDRSRAHRDFQTQPDQHGRYLVHAVKVDDVDVEGEYSEVHFSLQASPALDEAGLYLMGDFTYGNLVDDFRMEYNPESELFEKTVLLKQGAYNYLYSSPAVEGNHYETPNEYDVQVYYRPFGSRYDRLIGSGIIK